MNAIQLPSAVVVTQTMDVVAHPRAGIGVSEARDKWLEAGNSRILDDGGRSQPVLLVAREKGQTVLYELVPELCPPGFTVDQAMAHMRAAGFDVRGEGPRSKDGHPTVVVAE